MDVDTVRRYMEEARTTVQDMVDLNSRDTGAEDFWLQFPQKETFAIGRGFKQKKKTREQSYIPPDLKWTDVDSQFNSAEGKACTICPVKLKFGSNFREIVLETLSLRGPDICYVELLALEEFSAELAHQYNELTRARRILYSNRYRDAYMLRAGRKYIMQAGFPFGETDGTFPDPTAGTVGLPHESIFARIAARFDAAGGRAPGQNAGMIGNAPIYWAMARPEVFDTIIRADAESRLDIRDSSMADELIRVSHHSQVYKRFRMIEDVEAPRFNYNETTDEWERVNYYREVKAAIGVIAEENHAYETALYDVIIFAANRLGPRAQKMPRAVPVGGNTGMGTLHSDFNFRFYDYGDLQHNLLQWNGFFFGNAFEAIDPGHSRFVAAVMVARNVGGVTITAATSTSTPAATERDIADAAQPGCCEFLTPSACANAEEFTCASVTVAGHDNGLELYPIEPGTVVEGSDYNIAPLDVTFTAVEVDGKRVVFGYADPAVSCDDIIKEWQVSPA